MKLLYSNILPLGTDNGQETVSDRFFDEARSSERIDIATGYVSKASLLELDSLIESANIRNITLTIGMYFVEGMPEGTYHTALGINKKWKDAGIGEIRQ